MRLIPVVVFVHCSWRLNPSADGEGEILPSAYALLPGHYYAGDDPESDLRYDEPQPVNPLVEHGIQRFENTVEQTRP